VSAGAATRHVAGAVLRRNLRHAFKNPALLLPSVLFPLIFLIGFAGGLSRVGNVPGFDFPPGYTTFQFVFVFLQASAFGGVFTGFAIARDFESGFGRRLLLAAPHRFGLVLGYLGAAACRFLLTGAVVTAGGLIGGMKVDGSPGDLVALLLLALILNAAATLWAAGVALRLQTIQAGPAMQIPVFLVLFLAPVYVPLELLDGWIHGVASWNPLTAMVEAGRGFISGRPDVVVLAFACGAALVAVFLVWAVGGLRRAERGAT
jgi:ABC-2 type transport system permease protein